LPRATQGMMSSVHTTAEPIPPFHKISCRCRSVMCPIVLTGRESTLATTTQPFRPTLPFLRTMSLTMWNRVVNRVSRSMADFRANVLVRTTPVSGFACCRPHAGSINALAGSAIVLVPPNSGRYSQRRARVAPCAENSLRVMIETQLLARSSAFTATVRSCERV
jgi:hypothetical protein